VKLIDELSELDDKTPAPLNLEDGRGEIANVAQDILFHHYDEIKRHDLTEAELAEIITNYCEENEINLTKVEIEKVKLLIKTEESPFGPLDVLVKDPSVTDIIVAGFDKVLYVKDRKTFKTNIQFHSKADYQRFLEKLLYRAGTICNTKKPIADGAIGNVRLNCVHDSVCQGGPYLTLRISRFESVSLKDLEEKDLASKDCLEYLKFLVKAHKTVLIAGEVGTGKTTLARALANTIEPWENILVIEDTPEIKLDHPFVRYLLTREANMENVGEITQSNCVWAGMRMAMNRIIVGEIRDAKAAEAFIDVCASGHSGLSTIHARSTSEALHRLCLFLSRAQKFSDESVHQKQIGMAISAIAHLFTCPVTRKRRISEIIEISNSDGQGLKKRYIAKYIFSSDGDYRWDFNGSLSQFKNEFLDLGLSASWLDASH